MTLALYGKSRRRQGGLILAALLAILVATVGGLSVITSAFAHHNDWQRSRTCDEGWAAAASYYGGSEERLIVVSDVVINGAPYATNWDGNFDNPNSGIVSFASLGLAASDFATNTLPAGTTLYGWKGIDSDNDGKNVNGVGGADATIFDRSGTAGSFDPNWSGYVQLYKKNASGKWTTDGAAITISAPSAATNCGKIIVKKVVTGSGANANQTFSVDVVNLSGGPGGSNNNSFSSVDPYETVFDPGSSGDNFDVREDEPSGNWKLTAKKVLNGDANCDTGTWIAVTDDSVAANRTVSVPDVDRNETRTVCFRNEFTQTDSITISQGACTPGASAWTFHFIAPNTPAGQGGNITVGYKIDGGATQTTAAQAEDSDNDAKADWHVSIPFGGGSTITIVSATTSNGISWNGVNGLDKATASSTACQTQVVNPSVKKMAHSPQIDNGFALFDIVIDQPSSGAQAITGMTITDAKTDIQIVDDGTATCTVSNGVLTCDVTTADATIVVKRPVNANTLASGSMCQGGTIENWLTSAALASGTSLTITAGGAGNKVSYSVPADLTACDGQITMTKAHQMISGETEAWWRITITSTFPVEKTVKIEDIGTPTDNTPTLITGAGTYTCSSVSQNGDVFTCVVPANSTVYFNVWTTLPTYTGTDRCVPHEVVNTAYLLDPDNTSGNHDGNDPSDTGEYTIPADMNDPACKGTIRINKDNNAGAAVGGATFKLTLNSEAICVTDNQASPAAVAACAGATPRADENPAAGNTVVSGLTIGTWTVTEVQAPLGYGPDTCGGTRIAPLTLQAKDWSIAGAGCTQASSGWTAFHNEALQKSIRFSKYICETYGNVPANQGPGGQDDIGNPVEPSKTHSDLGPEVPAGANDPTAAGPYPGCTLATEPWDFQIFDSGRSNGSGGILLQTVTVTGSQVVALEADALAETLEGPGAYVEEVFKPDYGFGIIKCYTDHLNDDNWEWLDFSGGIPAGEVNCVAFNVPAGTVEIEKSDATKVGSALQWTVTLTNSSFSPKTVWVYDPNTSLVSDTCSNTVSEAPADYYECTIPAKVGSTNGTATLVLATGYPTDRNICEPFEAKNTAYIAANNTSGSIGALDQDGGNYSEDAAADASCATVNKTSNQDATTWTITFTNTGAPLNITFTETASVDIQSITGNPNNPVCSDSDGPSWTCTVTIPNGGLTLTVTTALPAATCSGTDVTNSIVATVVGGPAIPVANGGSTLAKKLQVNGDEGECEVTINLCKVWRLAPGEENISADPFDFDFTVEGTPVDIDNVVEDGDPVCVGVTVTNNDLEEGIAISEVVPAGFVTPSHSINGGNETVGSSLDLTYGECAPVSLLAAQTFNALFSNLVTIGPADSEPLCTVTFYNDDTTNLLPTGNLRIEKYLDINGDGDANDPGEGPISGWNMTVSGPDPAVNGTHATVGGVVDFNGLETGDIYSITEETRAGYHVTNATVNGISVGAVTQTNATIPNGSTVVVRYFNQPLGSIKVNKATYSTVDGITNPTPQDRDGWKITVKSAACGINQFALTDAAGNATFSNLPLCTDYVVAEDLTAPGASGYSPVGAASVANVTPGISQATQVNFVNEKRSTTPPPCSGPCRNPETPTPTPTTPTATPVTPTNTPVPTNTTVPTNTPVPTTAAPSQTSVVGGERTPGPGGPTPIAPSTGSGLFGGSGSGINIVLVVAGLLALTSGLSVVALGRKRR